MTRVLYLVSAHTQPEQVQRLVRALLAASEHGLVLLHYDAKGPRFDWPLLQREPRFHLFPDPISVRWGSFSIVESFLLASRHAMQHIPFDWLAWISGQDYPLGPLHDYERRLAEGGADAFVRHFPATTHPTWPKGEGRARYHYHYYALPRLPWRHRWPEFVGDTLHAVGRRLNRSQSWLRYHPSFRGQPALLGLKAAHPPFDDAWPCWGGSQWVNLSRASVQSLLDSVQARPELVHHYRRTRIADESFIHTVLANTPALRLANESLRYVHWGARATSSPQVITDGQALEAALASGMPFARKFDARVDAGVLDLLDRRIAA